MKCEHGILAGLICPQCVAGKEQEASPAPAGSASIGPAQKVAAKVWEDFKAEGLCFTDMLEMVAVLMVNIADKSRSKDIEIVQWTQKLMRDMRKNQRMSNVQGEKSPSK